MSRPDDTERSQSDDVESSYDRSDTHSGHILRRIDAIMSTDGTTSAVCFTDVVGLNQATAALHVHLNQSSMPAIVTGGIPPSSGTVLLYGPPGTGKTMLGDAIRNAFQPSCAVLRSCDLESNWPGESREFIEAMCAAVISKKGVLFIDDIDTIFSSRAIDEANSLRATLMQQIDKMRIHKHRTCVVATTTAPVCSFIFFLFFRFSFFFPDLCMP